MDILIIGNGFDLAHGLKTSYGEFLEFCKEQAKTSESATYFDYKHCLATNLWLKHFINRQKKLGDTWIDLEKEIYNVIKIVNSHPIVTYSGTASMFCPQILTINTSDSSFDFYSFNKYNNPYLLKARHSDCDNYEIIEDTSAYRVHFGKPEFFINFLYDQLREFTKAFELYLLNEVTAKLDEAQIYSLELIAKHSTVHVLSFNYTDTCHRLYDCDKNSNSGYKIYPYFVHGKAEYDSNSKLVLGTKSFKASNNPKTISSQFNIFQKHNQRHKYNTIEPYQGLLKGIKLQKDESVTFYVLGHSLDETDRNILKHVFSANKDAMIRIYYHDEESQERLINNITDIIGEEEVMTRVQLIDQYDTKRGILRPVEKTVLTSS